MDLFYGIGTGADINGQNNDGPGNGQILPPHTGNGGIVTVVISKTSMTVASAQSTTSSGSFVNGLQSNCHTYSVISSVNNLP